MTLGWITIGFGAALAVAAVLLTRSAIAQRHDPHPQARQVLTALRQPLAALRTRRIQARVPDSRTGPAGTVRSRAGAYATRATVLALIAGMLASAAGWIPVPWEAIAVIGALLGTFHVLQTTTQQVAEPASRQGRTGSTSTAGAESEPEHRRTDKPDMSQTTSMRTEREPKSRTKRSSGMAHVSHDRASAMSTSGSASGWIVTSAATALAAVVGLGVWISNTGDMPVGDPTPSYDWADGDAYPEPTEEDPVTESPPTETPTSALTMPNLDGVDVGDAERQLRQLGFINIEWVPWAPWENSPELLCTVWFQEPEQGELASYDAVIRLDYWALEDGSDCW